MYGVVGWFCGCNFCPDVLLLAAPEVLTYCALIQVVISERNVADLNGASSSCQAPRP